MNFATFDLNLLRVLDALLREGSTIKAGDRLGLSQPAVSSALSRLRQALGDPLFIRKGQGLTPTDYARQIAIPLRAELDRLEALISGPPAFDPTNAVLTFRLAGSDFFAELLMPRLAQELGSRAPGVQVQLVDLVPDSYVTSLERYEADLALIPQAAFPDWVDTMPLFHSTFVVVARKGHFAITRAGISPGDVLEMETFLALGHVIFSPEGNLRAMGDAALAQIGRTRRVVMSLPAFSGVCRSVAESDLIALVPLQLGVSLAGRLGLSLYTPPMPLPRALMMGVWHKRASGNPAHRWMRNLVAELLSPLNEGGAPLPASTDSENSAPLH